MTVALVLPALPTYSETFLNNKIKGLRESGFEVILMVVGVSPKSNMGVPVYYQPILAASGPMRLIHTFWLIAKSIFKYPTRSLKLMHEAELAGYKSFGKWRMLAVLSNFLKIKTDWIHFAYATMAVERAFIGNVLQAKVSMSLRGYDISIYPVLNPGVYHKVWPYINKVHSISTDLAEAAINQGMPASMPVSIIHPAIDANRFASEIDRDWSGKPRFLTVARLHWKKGLEQTLEALALLNFDFEYTIIGEGADFERLVFAAHQLNILDKVKFAGKKTSAEVVKAMQAHHLYLQYSLQEGFCNAVLEAQATGLLCVVSDAEGLAENVLHGETGWVVPKRNPSLLAKAIQYAWAIPVNEKRAISKAASARVKRDFDLKKQQIAFQQFFAS